MFLFLGKITVPFFYEVVSPVFEHFHKFFYSIGIAKVIFEKNLYLTCDDKNIKFFGKDFVICRL